MSKVRITFDLEEIKTLCNALCHVFSDDLQDQYRNSPVYVDPERFEQIKTICFTGKSFLMYPRIHENDSDLHVEVIK